MKALRIHEHGGPEVLRYEETPAPKPGPNEVLVQVRACALNHLDLFVRGGLPGLTLAMPHTLGSDAAGEVVEAGPLCSRVKPGDRILVAPGKNSWQTPEAMRGDDNLARDYGLFGYQCPGVQAELIAIPESNALPVPGTLSWEEAASIPLVFQTAWHMLVGLAKIRFCEDVLVVGGASGVGIAAIQIAKLHHCRVIATAGGEDKIAKTKALGADHVIDHYAHDIKTEVRNIVGKKGCDVVFEHVGKATWPHSMACLAHHGRLVTCGATTGADVSLNLSHLFAKQLRLQGSFMGTMGELWDVLRLFDRGLLEPVVDRIFPLAEARAAHEYLEGKHQFGKVVLVP
jgi:NADPH:quinone reductase-like Zn-dependent oxidoreductase